MEKTKLESKLNLSPVINTDKIETAWDLACFIMEPVWEEKMGDVLENKGLCEWCGKEVPLAPPIAYGQIFLGGELKCFCRDCFDAYRKRLSEGNQRGSCQEGVSRD